MKKTYLFIITTFLAFTFTAKAQFNTLNQLNNNELLEISFNKISLGDIMDISGNDQKAEALFGKGNFDSIHNDYLNPNPNSSEDCPSWCKYYQFFNNGMYVRFEKFSKNENVYHLTYLKIKNPSVKVAIKGVSVSLGDNINAFNNFKVNEKNNWVVFIDEQTATIDITFYFDPTTRKITNIKMHTY